MSPSLLEIPFKKRSDLIIHQQTYAGETFYVIKDPITLKYYRIRKIEYAIFNLLDGRRTPKDIQSSIAERFSGLIVPLESITNFIAQLRSINLLEDPTLALSKTPPGVKSRARWLGWISRLKFPFFDPDRSFSRFIRYIWFLWTRPFLGFYTAVLLTGLIIGIMNSSEFLHQAQAFLSGRNIFIALGVLFFIRIFHELGHGLTCKRYGGEVHEMGLFLSFLFIPYLYCDVSDAWIFKRHLHRFLVTVAGMATEFFIAAWACIIWWLTPSGLLNDILYNTIFVSSVYTLFFNGNPLMRFDGYFALADYLEEPNLRQRAQAYLFQWFGRHVLRLPVQEAMSVTPRQRRIYLIYGPLSFIYTWFIMIAIVSVVSARFYIVGLVLAGIIVAGFVFYPIGRFITFLIKSRKDMRINRKVWIPSVAGVFTIIPLVLFLISTEVKVHGSCTLEPAKYVTLRAEVEGFLEELYHSSGSFVEEGSVIAQLRNPEISSTYEKLLLDREILESEIAQAMAKSEFTDYKGYTIKRDQVLKELQEAEAKLEKLSVKAPVSGFIMTRRLSEKLNDYVKVGEELCELGEIDETVVRVTVGEGYLPDIRPGCKASVKFHAYSEKTFPGVVSEVSPESVSSLSNPAVSLKYGGDVATSSDYLSLEEVPILPTYIATVELEGDKGLLKPGMTGVAKIYGQRHSLGSQLARGFLRLVSPKRLI